MFMFGIFAILLSMVTFSTGDDKMVTVGDVNAKVLETSGTIRVYTGTDDTNGVQVIYHYLKEFDAEGTEIENTVPHAFETFDSLTFTFSEPENTTFGSNNVAVRKFTATASTPIASETVSFMISICVFTEDGSVSVDGSDVVVKSGDVKFDVTISNWPFCDDTNTCQKEDSTSVNGAFLDFGFEVKGKGDSTPENKTGNVYKLGADNKIIMPKQITIDAGSPQDVPADYPKLETKNSKEVFVVRFNLFTSSAKYEPIIMTEMGDTPGEEGSGENPDDTTTPDTTETSESMSESGMEVVVLKSSGRMTFMVGTDQIVVELKKIVERVDGGDEIQTIGHKYETFTNQGFTTGEVMEGTFQSLGIKNMTFMTTLDNDATLKIHLYIFKEDGTITNGDEMVNVTKGNAKFTIELSGWKFCGDSGVTCSLDDTDEVGSHLDIEITAQGESSEPEMKTVADAGKVYDLGSGLINLFSQYTRDGSDTQTSMPEGYPSNSMEVFTMRFDKFTTSILYDPVIMMEIEGDSSAPAHVSLLSLVMMIVHAVKYFFN